MIFYDANRFIKATNITIRKMIAETLGYNYEIGQDFCLDETSLFPFGLESKNKKIVVFFYSKTSSVDSVIKKHGSNISYIGLYRTEKRPSNKLNYVIFYRIVYKNEQSNPNINEILIDKVDLQKVLLEKSLIISEFQDVYYKYKSLDKKRLPNKKSTYEYTKDLIKNGRLYFPTPSQLNDPFECKFDDDFNIFKLLLNAYDKANTHKTSIWTIYFNLMEYLEDNYTIKDDLILLINKYISKYNLEISTEVSENFLNSNSIKIMSLTSKYTDILMWSYYGDSHSGVCLEFLKQDLIDGIVGKRSEIKQAWIGKVIYNKDRPHFKDMNKLSFFASKSVLEMIYIISVVFTKYDGWKHENETRIALITKNIDDFTIKCFPKHVYLGVNGKNSDIDSMSLTMPHSKLQIDKNEYMIKK